MRSNPLRNSAAEKVASCRHFAALLEPRAELHDPGFHLRARPVHVAVLEYRREVIADRTPQCVLEVDDTGRTRRQHHEIAGVIVAVHERLGLHQRFAHEECEGVFQQLLLGDGQREPEVDGAEPLRQQAHFAQQHRLVIGRQLARGGVAIQLQPGKRFERVPYNFCDRLPPRDW